MGNKFWSNLGYPCGHSEIIWRTMSVDLLICVWNLLVRPRINFGSPGIPLRAIWCLRVPPPIPHPPPHPTPPHPMLSYTTNPPFPGYSCAGNFDQTQIIWYTWTTIKCWHTNHEQPKVIKEMRETIKHHDFLFCSGHLLQMIMFRDSEILRKFIRSHRKAARNTNILESADFLSVQTCSSLFCFSRNRPTRAHPRRNPSFWEIQGTTLKVTDTILKVSRTILKVFCDEVTSQWSKNHAKLTFKQLP